MAEQPVTIFTPARNPPTNPSPAAPQQHASPVRDARTVDGIRSDPLMSEPQRRWRADFDELTRQDVWRNPDVVISKNADGSLSARPRNGGQTGAPGVPGSAPSAPGTDGQPQPRPQAQQPAATTDGTKLRIGELELTEADVRGLLERKSLEDGRRALVPTEPALTTSSCQATFRCPPGWSGVGT
jgi:hypothetical protein